MKTSNRINIKRELIWTFGIIKNNLFSVIFFCSPSQSLMNTFSFFFLREKVKFLKGKKLKIFTWSPIKQITWYYVLDYRFSYKAFQGVLGWAKPLPDLHDVVRLSGQKCHSVICCILTGLKDTLQLVKQSPGIHSAIM